MGMPCFFFLFFSEKEFVYNLDRESCGTRNRESVVLALGFLFV